MGNLRSLCFIGRVEEESRRGVDGGRERDRNSKKENREIERRKERASGGGEPEGRRADYIQTKRECWNQGPEKAKGSSICGCILEAEGITKKRNRRTRSGKLD